MKLKKLVSSQMVLRTFGESLEKNWYWEWYDEKGRRCKKYGEINRHNSVEERHDAAEKLRVRLLSGIQEVKPSVSVIYQHIYPHLERHCEVLRKASKKDYYSVFRVFEGWLLREGYKHTHPKRFTKQDAEKFCRFIEIEKKRENATFNKYVNVLDMLFGYLVENDITSKSVFSFIKRKVKQSVSVSAFKEEAVAELKKILKERNMTVYIACMVDMYAFIRPNEIRNLKLKDIDLINNRIYIDKTVSKNKKSQHVAIVAPLREILMDYIGGLHSGELYLLSKSGRPGQEQISSKYVVENHNRILEGLGYDTKKFKPYSWKHTGNSLAYKNGASIRFLKMQNRHHSEAMTEIYIKSIVPEDLVENEEKYFSF